MIKLNKPVCLLFYFLLFGFFACEKNNVDNTSPTDVILISHYGDSISHRNGENCRSCHRESGGAPGIFNVSGSVFDSASSLAFPNASLRLYTEAGGKGIVQYELEGDALGNFFSTEQVNFGNGLFPVVLSDSSTRSMGSFIQHGHCNACHGITTNRIKIN